MRTLYKAAASLIAALGIPQLGHAGIIWDLNGHEYELVNAEGMSWTAADALVSADGWHLATVTSLAENCAARSMHRSVCSTRSSRLAGSSSIQVGWYVSPHAKSVKAFTLLTGSLRLARCFFVEAVRFSSIAGG